MAHGRGIRAHCHLRKELKMDKPRAKNHEYFDYHECAKYIEQKYNIDLEDSNRAAYEEWHKKHDEYLAAKRAELGIEDDWKPNLNVSFGRWSPEERTYWEEQIHYERNFGREPERSFYRAFTYDGPTRGSYVYLTDEDRNDIDEWYLWAYDIEQLFRKEFGDNFSILY